MISCILLAAGFSSRFGEPKATADLGKETLITHLQNELSASRLDEIIVVLGAHAQRIKPFILNHKKIKVVYNKDYNLGQTSSIQAGLKELHGRARAFMLLPVDYPLINAGLIDGLIGQFKKKKAKILIPVFNKKRGHPPVFATSLKGPCLALSTDKGLNSLIHEHEEWVDEIDLDDPAVIKTFNTKEEFEAIRLKEVI